MLESVGRLTRYDQPVRNLIGECGFLVPSAEEKLFFEEKRALEALGKHPHLCRALDRLLSL